MVVSALLPIALSMFPSSLQLELGGKKCDQAVSLLLVVVAVVLSFTDCFSTSVTVLWYITTSSTFLVTLASSWWSKAFPFLHFLPLGICAATPFQAATHSPGHALDLVSIKNVLTSNVIMSIAIQSPPSLHNSSRSLHQLSLGPRCDLQFRYPTGPHGCIPPFLPPVFTSACGSSLWSLFGTYMQIVSHLCIPSPPHSHLNIA